MNKSCLLSVFVAFLMGCANTPHKDSEGDEAHSHAHGGEIVIDPQMAARLGVESGRVEPGNFRQVIRASGVLERSASDQAIAPASTAGTIKLAPGITAGTTVKQGSVIATIDVDAVSGGNVDAAARAEYESALAEFKRVDALFADRLVTASEHNAAKAAVERTRAALSRGGESQRVVSPISGTITAVVATQGAFVQAGDPVAMIAADGPLTLRVDAASRHYALLGSVTDAKFSVNAGQVLSVSELGGRRLPGTSADGANGYIPVYFSIPAASGLPSGASAEVWLLGEERSGVISVPKDALCEQQGRYYVYQAVHPEHGEYRKIPVTLGDNDGQLFEIIGGLNGDEDIVIAGTTAVRLAEMQNVIPEGHSHTH